MGFWKQLGIGFNGYFKALGLIFTWKFFRYMFFPLLLNIAIFWVGMEFIADLAELARAFVHHPDKYWKVLLYHRGFRRLQK